LSTAARHGLIQPAGPLTQGGPNAMNGTTNHIPRTMLGCAELVAAPPLAS